MLSTAPAAVPAYRPDIDGLRALAVLAVVLCHLDPRLLPGGYLGVDVFFVISGFVITLSLVRHPAPGLGALLFGFYARRCRRLLPSLALCVLASGVLAWMLDPAPATSLVTGLAALAGLSNLALLRAAADYFAPGARLNLFTQTWSLGVEEQFYLVFPVLAWAAGRGHRGGPRRLFATCVVASALSAVLLVLMPGPRGGAAYYLVFGRLWELGAGCAAAAFCLGWPAAARRLAVPGLATAGLLLVVAGFAAPLSPTVLASFLVVPPAALLILAGPAAGPVPRGLAARPVAGLGRMSYSLYLWHWPVVSAAALLWGPAAAWWRLPLELALMLGLGWLSWRLVETPARRVLSRRRPRASYAVAALAAFSVAGAP